MFCIAGKTLSVYRFIIPPLESFCLIQVETHGRQEAREHLLDALFNKNDVYKKVKHFRLVHVPLESELSPYICTLSALKWQTHQIQYM